MIMHKQVNIALAEEWKKQLEHLARLESVKREQNITYHDLIRAAIQEKYNLQNIVQGKVK